MNIKIAGLGHWQKKILSQLEQTDSFTLNDLLPEYYTEAEIAALHRAARSLGKLGLVILGEYSRNQQQKVSAKAESLIVSPRARFTLREMSRE